MQSNFHPLSQVDPFFTMYDDEMATNGGSGQVDPAGEQIIVT